MIINDYIRFIYGVVLSSKRFERVVWMCMIRPFAIYEPVSRTKATNSASQSQ